MALSLPTSPTTNQVVTTEGKTYQWNGTFWKIVSITPSNPKLLPWIL